MSRSNILKSSAYWAARIQLSLYERAQTFMKSHNLNKTGLAEHLGVTKGYVSQLMAGDYDHKLSKFVELSLSFGYVPKIEFIPVEDIMKEKAKVQVIIEKGDDGTYSAYPATLKTVIVGEGDTAEEAKNDFINSYDEIVAYYADSGDELPAELKDIEFEFRYDLSAFFNYFKFINASALAKAVGVEPSLMRHYKVGKTGISRTQAKKIESRIHSLAKELQEVRL